MIFKNKNLVKNLASTGLIQIANFVVPIISIPFISRIIGPEKFGAINYAGAFAIYFNMFINYGFNLTGTRRIAKDPDNKDYRNKVYSEIFYAQVVLFIISILLFTVFLFYIPQLNADKRVAIYSMLMCISSVFTRYWLFQAMQNLSIIAIINLIGKIIYLILVIFLIREENDYYIQPLILSISFIAIGFISHWWAQVKYDITLVKVPIKSSLMLLWNEKAFFLSTVFTSLYTTANIFILGLFENNTAIGYYTAGQKLIAVLQSIITIPLSQVFYPIISRKFSVNAIQGIESVQKLIPIIIGFTALLFITTLLIGPYFVTIFYGPEFEPAVASFKILSIVPLFSALSNVLGIQLMLNLNLDKQYFYIVSACSVLSVVLNIFMVQVWGYIGCAINWSLTEFIILIVIFLYINNVVKVRVYNKGFFKLKYIADLIKIKN